MSERMYILDAVLRKHGLFNWMIVISYDVENMQRIVLCKMYLKYLISNYGPKKNCKIFK